MHQGGTTEAAVRLSLSSRRTAPGVRTSRLTLMRRQATHSAFAPSRRLSRAPPHPHLRCRQPAPPGVPPAPPLGLPSSKQETGTRAGCAHSLLNALTGQPYKASSRRRPTGRRKSTQTGEAAPYMGMNRKHGFVKRSVRESVNRQAYSNRIELFWAGLKRCHHGAFLYLSDKHPHRHVGSSQDGTMSVMMIPSLWCPASPRAWQEEG